MPKGLIDRQEVFAFVLNDALGRPLLPHDVARGVGQASDNAVAGAIRTKPPERKGKLLKAQEAAREAVRSAQRAATKDSALLERVTAAVKAGKEAVAAVLAVPVDLKLPNATVGAKRKRCASEAAPTAEAAPTPESRLTKLRQAVHVADCALQTAQQVASADRHLEERAGQRFDALNDPNGEPPVGWYEDASYRAAEQAAADTEDTAHMSDVAVLRARLKWQDAHAQYHLELSQQVLAENTRLHADNTRMHELLNAYRGVQMAGNWSGPSSGVMPI